LGPDGGSSGRGEKYCQPKKIKTTRSVASNARCSVVMNLQFPMRMGRSGGDLFHGVVSAVVPRVASGEAGRGTENASGQPVAADHLIRVICARRKESAGWREEWGNDLLVKP
jgi:hypothetical protein